MAQIESEKTSRSTGAYIGTTRLFQDDTDEGIDSCTVSVRAVPLRGVELSPFSDEEDEAEFGDLVEDDFSTTKATRKIKIRTRVKRALRRIASM